MGKERYLKLPLLCLFNSVLACRQSLYFARGGERNDVRIGIANEEVVEEEKTQHNSRLDTLMPDM